MAEPERPENPDPPDLVELITKSGRHFEPLTFQLPEKQSGPTARLVRELGPGLQPALKQPFALHVTGKGQILIMDRPQPQLFRIQALSLEGQPNGLKLELAKGSADHELLEPTALASDQEGNLAIVDSQDGSVKKFAPDGRWLDTLRSAGSAGRMFNIPQDLAIDDQDNIYVADTGNARIVMLRPDGELGWVLDKYTLSSEAGEPEEFYEPYSLCWSTDGLLWIADRNTNRVLAFDEQRTLVACWPEETVESPSLIRFDPQGKAVFVADDNSQRIQRCNRQGQATAAVKFPLEAAEQAAYAGSGLFTVGPEGHLLVIDSARESVLLLALTEK